LRTAKTRARCARNTTRPRRLILRAWSEPDPFAFNGRFTQLRYVNIWPRPIQRPHPPIWVPGGGARETWARCAREGYVFAALSYFGFEASRSVLGGYWQEVERHGRSRNPFQAGYLQFVGVAETGAEAMALYREHERQPAQDHPQVRDEKYDHDRCGHGPVCQAARGGTSAAGADTSLLVGSAAMSPVRMCGLKSGEGQGYSGTDAIPTFPSLCEAWPRLRC
jgi:alkanesulfonate monooxygenase SsuD/methylene tetrahydromethanopterin reductase-like flavin-dependent oxidoreductase (luciferase family)